MCSQQKFLKTRAELELGDISIGPPDMMIAGHVKSLGCIPVTNNTREFSRVRGLDIENRTE